jgi:hypothetical protein
MAEVISQSNHFLSYLFFGQDAGSIGVDDAPY